MKKILTVVLLLSAMTANAQLLKFGAKAGASFNTSNLKFSVPSVMETAGHPTGFNAGIMLRVNIPLTPVYVQGDVLYNFNQYKYDVTQGDVVSAHKTTMQTLDIPVVVGVKLLFIRFYVGPVFTATLANSDNLSLNSDVNNLLSPTKWAGYQVGAGVDIIKRISIDVNFNGKFSKSKQSFVYYGKAITSTLNDSHVWLTVGYYFL